VRLRGPWARARRILAVRELSDFGRRPKRIENRSAKSRCSGGIN